MKQYRARDARAIAPFQNIFLPHWGGKSLYGKIMGHIRRISSGINESFSLRVVFLSINSDFEVLDRDSRSNSAQEP